MFTGISLFFEKEISFIVYIEAPMVLVETSKGHKSAIIYLDCFHVQILERLLVHFSTILVQVCE